MVRYDRDAKMWDCRDRSARPRLSAWNGNRRVPWVPVHITVLLTGSEISDNVSVRDGIDSNTTAVAVNPVPGVSRS